MPADTQSLRRGLPRVPGGEPWPLAGSAGAAPAPAVVAQVDPVQVAAAPIQTIAAPTRVAATPLRRGLPRMAGGDPWPPETVVPAAAAAELPAAPILTAQSEPEASAVPTAGPAAKLAGASPAQAPAHVAVPAAPAGPAAEDEPARQRHRGRARSRWVRLAVVGIPVIVVEALLIVLAVRYVLGTDGGEAFLDRYPGEYQLPEWAPVGFPAWLGWQHFFNAFFMLLIIRTGLQIRREQRPAAYWTPRWSKNGRKISLTIWLHQSLDLLWIANGVIFVVLLFATGQWVRVVPTSWEVFPNALSAGLQYASLDWPTENGWVNYNSLQQLAYFATIFLAAPLAALTGVRMSGLWPSNAQRLSRWYPVEAARAVHFPVMLYFVLFIVMHVALVLSTGALRNLNHMYGAQDAENWVGFWIFAGSLVVMAGALLVARPLVVAPIAAVFGRVGR